MYKNYFFFLRAVYELQNLIIGKSVSECFTQEKDKLILTLTNPNVEESHLILSSLPQHQFISIRRDYRKAKKNTFNFFNDYFPAAIKNIEIALGDRIVKFDFGEFKLFFVVEGSNSNVLLIDSGNQIKSFKKISEARSELILRKITEADFIIPDASSEKYFPQTGLASISKLPYAGKDVLHLITLMKSPSLTEFVSIIITDRIHVYYDELQLKTKFMPASFIEHSDISLSKYYDSYFSALQYYFSINYRRQNADSLKKEIEKFLNSELSRLSNKINKLKVRVENGSKENIFKETADLLLMNRHNIFKGMNEIEIEKLDLTKTKIVLDPKLSSNQNIDRYYEKSRDEKIEYQKSVQFFETAVSQYSDLLDVKSKFENTNSIDELKQIKSELKMDSLNSSQLERKEKFPYRHFIIDGKYHLYVGKDSKNNDQLTTQFAKQNDYWFHARSVSGSHTVLRVENIKEAIPKNILEAAASIAAFYSKSKTSKLAPVAYTLKKYVVKNKNLAPGAVILTKEKVLLVKPGIPKNTEQIEE